jgi:phage terminase large subunit
MLINSMIELEIPKDKFLPVYHHFLNKDEIFDVDFLYGGRDSGKSREVAHQVIMDCLQTKGYKCLLIRKILNTVRDSQYSLIQSVIEEWGLTRYFKFNSSRLEIICTLNGSGFYGRGLDEVGRIKSFNNPSACWIEEGNQITNEDFVVILTSLRSNFVRVKTWFSFNPECAVNYTDFWLYQEWFEHTQELSFKWIKQIQVDDEVIEFRVRATHSTYRDNPYCPAQRKALYESYAHSKNNSYWYQTYTLGLWGYRRTGDEFWKCFDEYKHTGDIRTIDSTYHIVLDSNVNPYVSVQIWQIDVSSMSLLQVGEIPCESPDNTAAKAAKAVIKYLDRLDYNDQVYIYGDPSANAKNTIDDEGRSFFDKFIGVMKASDFNIVKRVGSSAPSVSISGAFINEIMEVEYGGWKIQVDKSCRKSIEDYNMAKEDIDGSMLKKKTQNKETGVSYEKYGHMSDCMRYFITTVLGKLYKMYMTRRIGTPRAGGVATVSRIDKVTL